MFDAKIQDIVDKFGDKVKDAIDSMDVKIEELSYKMKVVIAVSIGLSIVDTILLLGILIKISK